MKRIPVVLILVLAPNAAAAQQRPTLQSLAIPQGEAITCEETALGESRNQASASTSLSTSGQVMRSYEIGPEPPFGIPGRVLTVGHNSETGRWNLSDLGPGMPRREMVHMIGGGDGPFWGMRTRTLVDTAAARAALEARDSAAYRRALRDSTIAITDADRNAARRLVEWLREVPCTRTAPVRMRYPSAPFIIMTVDTMPRIVPPESRYAVVRRPDEEIMDVVVIRKDALGIAVLDTAIAMLRVARARELEPERPTAVVRATGVPTMDSLLATKSFERLARAEVREVFLVGRGPAIEVPVLERQGRVMVRPARPPSQR